MIRFQNNLKGVKEENIKGFFVGWPNPPSEITFLKMLEKSAYIWLAIDEETNQVIGFINAISDFVLSSYIPLLEVLPEFQKNGYGKELVERMLDTLDQYYVTDLVCDEEKVPFYEKFNLVPARAMMRRQYGNQAGRK